MRGGWFYIMTNKPFGRLYCGVTADLPQRIWQHRNGQGSSHCRRFNLTRLVLAEEYPAMDEAIAREKQVKDWLRAWKLRRIAEQNPHWDDLWDSIVGAA